MSPRQSRVSARYGGLPGNAACSSDASPGPGSCLGTRGRGTGRETDFHSTGNFVKLVLSSATSGVPSWLRCENENPGGHCFKSETCCLSLLGRVRLFRGGFGDSMHRALEQLLYSCYSDILRVTLTTQFHRLASLARQNLNVGAVLRSVPEATRAGEPPQAVTEHLEHLEHLEHPLVCSACVSVK
ncbi:hypothetical protein D4764_10G0000230 [Takifugu flavidus]|uniref:Uncharacterized protein n=1 Tax=Takifugu flavidus TaxID=433684 RepID=A0A5C6PHJ4_9TELE|nr:hypothetical protein D4764_10G0000230 [Takifugu flavidus]